MNIQEVYEKYKEIDHLLSDRRWMGDGDGILKSILYDCWDAIIEEIEQMPKEKVIDGK